MIQWVMCEFRAQATPATVRCTVCADCVHVSRFDIRLDGRAGSKFCSVALGTANGVQIAADAIYRNGGCRVS